MSLESNLVVAERPHYGPFQIMSDPVVYARHANQTPFTETEAVYETRGPRGPYQWVNPSSKRIWKRSAHRAPDPNIDIVGHNYSWVIYGGIH